MALVTLSPFEKARIKFRDSFKRGIKPVDARQPIPDELALEMIQQLDVPKDAVIGVFDAFLILSTHLKEQGYTNIVVLESIHSNLTSLQEQYYTKVKYLCEKSNIKYYTPPHNNYNRCDMKFDVIIGNPPYQNGSHNSTTNSLWKQFLDDAVGRADCVSLVLPDIALAPPTFSKYNNHITQVNVDVKKYFKGVGSGFCSLLIEKNTSKKVTKVITSDGVVEFPIGSLDCIPNNFNQDILKEMNEFLTGTRKWNLSYEYESRKKIFTEDGKYDVLHTSSNGIRKTDVHHPNNDLIRVSVDVSGHPRFHYVHNMGLTQSHYWTVFESEQEAKEYVEWGNSEKVQSFLRKVKWGGMNSALIIKNLV